MAQKFNHVLVITDPQNVTKDLSECSANGYRPILMNTVVIRATVKLYIMMERPVE